MFNDLKQNSEEQKTKIKEFYRKMVKTFCKKQSNWNPERIAELVKKGFLLEEDYLELTGEAYINNETK